MEAPHIFFVFKFGFSLTYSYLCNRLFNNNRIYESN